MNLNYYFPVQQTHFPIQSPQLPYFLYTTPYFTHPTFQNEFKENQFILPQVTSDQTYKLYLQQNIVNQQISKTISCVKNLVLNSEEKQKNRIQRQRDNKGRYYGTKKFIAKEKYKQNPKRNVITNIGNQLLAFSSNRSRSEGIIKKIEKNVTQQELSSFYQFMHQLRQTTDYYLNINKMRDVWYPECLNCQGSVLKNRALFRMISYYYLNNMIHLFILNSAKIKKSSKIYHVKAIRSLIKELAIRTEI